MPQKYVSFMRAFEVQYVGFPKNAGSRASRYSNLARD